MHTGDSFNRDSSGDRNSKPNIEPKLKMFAAIIAALLLAGYIGVHHMRSVYNVDLAHATQKAASAPPVVDVITVQNAPPWSSLTLPGETSAWYQSSIYARVDGYVKAWNVDIGDSVKKGQVLAMIDTPDLDAKLAAARAKVRAAMAMELVRKAEADFAKTTYDRWRNSPKGVVSAQECDAKKAGFNSASARLTQAKAQVGLDQALVDNLMALTQFKKVVAPYAGVIVKRHIDIGDLVTANSHNTKPLYRMVKDNPVRVFVFLPQRDADGIVVGSTARVTVNDLPDRVFTGRVARTADALNAEARTLRVEVDIPNPERLLLPGLYVNVRFHLPAKGLVVVPPAALVFRSSGPKVCVVDRNNRVSFRGVTIARDNGNAVELGSGVSVGDRIALNVSSQISNGDTVDPHELRTGLADAKNFRK
jgi:RND family efflux transporter MFP subunit